MIKFAIVVCLAAFVAADAEAEADPALFYGAYGYGLGYPYLSTYAHVPAYHHVGYAPRYYANSGGAVHIVKREAEAEATADATADADAEADAGYLYGAYVYGYAAPYAYRSHVYAPYAYRSYLHPYGYAHHYIGKRSADAEPEAEADAAAGYYGYYGYRAYGYPYGYRYHW